MSYVEDPCGHCGRYVPRYELAEVTDRVVTGGKTGAYRTYASGRSGYVGGHETYRIVRHLLCPSCYEKLLAEQRALELARALKRAQDQKRAAIIGGVLLAACVGVAGLVVATVRGQGDAPPTSGTATTGNVAAVQNTSSDGTTEVANSDNEGADDGAVNTVAPELQASQNMQPPPPATNAFEEKAAVAAITPENTSALSLAVADALNAGAAKPWAAHGRSGEVTVGEIRYYQGRPCRSFAYTVGGAASPTEYACDGLDGVWRPERRFQSQVAQ